MMAIVVVVLLVVLVVGGWVLTYNRLVPRRNRTREAWSLIDVELQRRHDLALDLVEAVRGYAAPERATMRAVRAARADAVAARTSGDPAAVGRAENLLAASLRSLLAAAENYPQLRATDDFVRLHDELTATQSRLELARRGYNTSAREYLSASQPAPRTLLARALGFGPLEFLEIGEVGEIERGGPRERLTAPGPRGPTAGPTAPDDPAD